MQFQYSQCFDGRPCAASLGGGSWLALTGTRRPFRVAAAAAHNSPGKRPSNSTASLAAATPTPRPPRAVADSGLASSSCGVEIDGKLLLQSFGAPSHSQLKLSLQLVSSTVAGDDGRGAKGEAATVVDAVIGAGERELDVKLPWDTALGSPGALVVTNHSDFPVYLQTVSLPGLGGDGGALHFICYGWVYPVGKHPYRLFFTNDTYVKETTPPALVKYREDELNILRGERATEPFQPWDRVYDYALYNDLGNPDLRKDLARPVLGGSDEYPYPRRGKTGRSPSRTDPRTESRAPLDQLIYIPCDERIQLTGGEPQPGPPVTGEHFKSFAEIYGLFGLDELGRLIKAKEVINSDAPAAMFPVPQVISVHPTAWRNDEEFAREMLAGSNPVSIKRVTKFPLTSKLDRTVYGDHDSQITKDHIEKHLGDMTVQQAVEKGRLYVVDHVDWVIPYLKRINELPGAEEKNEVSPRKVYATRTILLLNDDSTLKPLAIELRSPNPENEKSGAISMVYRPPDTTQDSTKNTHFTHWELAKVHAAANDTCQNNFVSHWLNTHATMEPFVIAANRQLSVLHPIHRLLKPHFRSTMNINALARQIVVGSGDRRKTGDIYRGINEITYFSAKYGMEMSSKAYKNWKFTELALPADLIQRGLAKGDPKNPEKLELLIKDYPYAVDGLDIWMAIKRWVTEYCAIYYATDDAVKGDSELQAWWWELRHVGHGDKRDETWWPRMDSVNELVETCTTIIWVGSGLHAAVSFGPYAYCGFTPNRPCNTTRPMPTAGTEVSESDFLGSITPMTESLMFNALALRAMPAPGEVFLGQRPDSNQWTKEQRAVNSLAEFGAKLESIADTIRKRNADPAFKNRTGPVEVPYTLLTPTTDPGPILSGIPNSITV